VLDPGEADAFVRGPAERLYLALWNRAPLSSVETSGDEQLLRSWSASVQVTWN